MRRKQVHASEGRNGHGVVLSEREVRRLRHLMIGLQPLVLPNAVRNGHKNGHGKSAIQKLHDLVSAYLAFDRAVLAQLRDELNLSQEEIGEICGWAARTVSRYETGVRAINIPPLLKLYKYTVAQERRKD